MRLQLIRHAKSQVSAGQIAGRSDVPALKPTSEALAEIKARLSPKAEVWRTPALRTKQTAAWLGLVPQRVQPLGWEQNFGDWEGRTWNQIGINHVFWTDPAHNRPPMGESFADLIERVRAIPLPRHDVTFICHAGVIRAFYALSQRLNADQFLNIDVQPLSLHEIVVPTG